MIHPFAYASDELRVMVRPTRTYRRLVEEANATDTSAFWRTIKRPLFAAFMIGAFASLTTSGQLNALLVMDGVIFWSVVPLLQGLIMACLVLVFARRRLPTAKAIDLFFIGHGPWFLWLLMISGMCLFTNAKQISRWPDTPGWTMSVSLLVMWAWSNVTTYAFLRGALNLTIAKAAVALLVYTFLLWGIIISYFFAIETIQLHRLGF